MSFATIAEIVGQLLAIAIVGGATASLCLRWLKLRGDAPPSGAPGRIEFRNIWFGAPERWLLTIAGFAAFAVVSMLLNIVSAGAFFGSRAAAPLLATAVLILWLRTKPFRDWWFLPRVSRSLSASWARLLPGLVLGAALFTIFILPALLAGSSVRTGDPPWHLGWTEQLLRGEAFPSGPAPEFGRNAYPWGLHAFMASLVRLVPGSSPLVSLETLHVLVVFAIPLAAACLVRTFHPAAGWYAAASAALIGGFGWWGASEPSFATSPADGAHGADLVVASPNSAYELLPPGLPRELGLVLLVGSLVLLVVYRNMHEPRAAVGAGAIAGITGLVSVPMFVAGLVWIAAAAFVHRGGRLRLLVSAFGVAAGVFSVWFGYAVFQAIGNGGFVNITPRLGMEWPLPTALASWGLLLPLAVFGIFRLGRLPGPGVHPLLAVLGGSLTLLALAVLRGVFDWDLAGNATVLHQGRVWPVVHLLAAAFAGYALALLYERIHTQWFGGAVVAVAAIFLLGVVSLVIARGSLHLVMEAREAGYEYASPDVRDASSFLNRAASFIGPSDIVEVEGSNRLAFRLFEFSGVKLASFDDERLDSNDLRIRYRDLASAWDERVSGGGFDADFTARRETSEPAPGEELLTTGTFGGETWSLYGAP